MDRRQDSCWNHAKDLTIGSIASFQCNYCLTNFDGGAPQIKAHLSKEENCGIRPCPQVPHDVVEIFSKRKRPSSEMEDEILNFLSLRATRPRVLEDRRDKRWVDHKLAKFITIFNLSSDVVKSPIFTNFVEAMAQYESYYELPDPNGVADEQYDYIADVYSYIKRIEGSLVDTGCTLMVDVDRGLYTYSLGGALYNGSGTKESIDRMFSIIDTCINSIGSTKVLQIFFDAHKDIYSSTLEKNLTDRYQWLKVGFSPTFEIGHLLQSNFSRPSLCVILNVASQLTTETDNCWFRVQLDEDHMTPFLSAYCDMQETIDIIDQFWKLKQLLKYRDEGQKFIVGDFIKSTHDEKRCVDHMMHCEEFWVQAKEWASVLQPLIEALFFITNKLCPPSGYLYQIMEMLRDTITKSCNRDREDINELVRECCEVRGKVMHPMYAAATFLNPAYMYSKILEEHGELRHGIDFIQNCLVEEDERTAFKNEFERYRMKDQTIFKKNAILVLESYHPARWWECYGDIVPTLKKYAIRILSQPCHTPDCHSLEPKWKCNQASDDFFNYITKEAVMMEYFGTIETKNLKAIDVSNVGLPEWLHEYQTDAFIVKLGYWARLILRDLNTCLFCLKPSAEWRL